jgi:hypothetical protein
MCKNGILQFFWIFPCVHFTKGPPQYKGEKREIEINIGHQSLFVNVIDTPGFFEVIVVNILLQVTSENPKNIDQGRSFEFLKLPEFQAGPRVKSWLLSLVQQSIAGCCLLRSTRKGTCYLFIQVECNLFVLALQSKSPRAKLKSIELSKS